MFAIISDIHGNLEALEAVLGDIDRLGIEEIYCLGDIVGYGASPRECLDLVIDRCVLSLCGNHDHAVFYEPSNFNPGAERACYWTRQVFEDEPKKPLRDRRWDTLGRLPLRHEVKDLLLVHASPRRPVNEYLFAEDVYTNPSKILANFERLEAHHRACLVGHTHVPGVFLDDPYFDPPGELPEPNRYVLTQDEKAIINVGSVGQPRDRDPRASYLIVHENGERDSGTQKTSGSSTSSTGAQSGGGNAFEMTVEFVRVEYDIEKSVKKILAVPDLDDFLGNRLYEGR
ncbi:MAG: metallophosphoesterase family protein [Planctomycetes bacterium]|nr:metallophosphoesterase family protein [Planctomycetota bacterium]